MQILMNNIIHSPMGAFHIAAAIFSMIVGFIMLVKSKGGSTHKKLGYAYVIGMLATNGSAFGLYHLFKTFGPFHFAALVALVTLLLGMWPALRRKQYSWVRQHMYWMHYSVVGLYAAFLSELIVRIPLGLPFFTLVGLGTALVMVVGAIIIYKKANDWLLEAISNTKKIQD